MDNLRKIVSFVPDAKLKPFLKNYIMVEGSPNEHIYLSKVLSKLRDNGQFNNHKPKKYLIADLNICDEDIALCMQEMTDASIDYIIQKGLAELNYRKQQNRGITQ